MKITFFSNFMNHHQLPFSKAMYEKIGENYKFVATSPIEAERLSLGYEDMNKKFPFIITTYDNEDNKDYAMKLALESDVIIIGSAPECYMSARLKAGKVTFKYSERFYKKGLSLRQLPRAYMSGKWHLRRFQKYPLFFLCSSAYTAADVNKFSNYKNRTFKWGYFPEIRVHKIDELLKLKKFGSIVWAGRLVDWKHPEVSISIAKQLKEDGHTFDLYIIGSGEMESTLKEMIAKNNLGDCVHMLGSMSPEKVRKYMEESEVFIFTSDFNEGWGAVLNESMNSGCAVVASHAIGSVPFLLKDGVNGLIYNNGDTEDLYKKVKMLLNNPRLRNEFGKQAYLSMENQWNAENAAERFLLLSNSILKKNSQFKFEDGICSEAKVIDNDWYGGL